MIFVTLGSQKFQFNRLLEEVDKLIEEGKIREKVFAQIGYSTYKPKFFDYEEFMQREQFTKKMEGSDLVITHGGTGAIITALKCGKKVIAVPRLKSFKEHVDDHQLQIVRTFEKMGYIEGLGRSISELVKTVELIKEKKYNKYVSNTEKYIESINNFIDEEV